MKKVKLLFLLLIYFLQGSCQKKNEVLWVEATPVRSVSEFSDTVFFKWIADIEHLDNQWVFLDKGTGKALITNQDFELINSVGASGPGPTEIRGATNVSVSGEKLFVYDYTGGKINIYDRKGHFIDSKGAKPFLSEFVVDSLYIYMCSNEDIDSPIEVLKIDNDSIYNRFGKEAIKKLNFPPQHIIEVQDFLVSVFAYNKPLIDVYDKSGTHLRRNDLSSDPVLAPWLDELNLEDILSSGTTNQTQAWTMFFDVYSVNEYLYAMPPPFIIEDKGKTSFVIEFVIGDDGKIETERYIELKTESGSSLSCFAISKDRKRILGYDPALGVISELLID